MGSVSQVNFRNCSYVMCLTYYCMFPFAEWFMCKVENNNTDTGIEK